VALKCDRNADSAPGDVASGTPQPPFLADVYLQNVVERLWVLMQTVNKVFYQFRIIFNFGLGVHFSLQNSDPPGSSGDVHSVGSGPDQTADSIAGAVSTSGSGGPDVITPVSNFDTKYYECIVLIQS